MIRRSGRLAAISVGILLMAAGLTSCSGSESDDYLTAAGEICNGQNEEITAAQTRADTAVGAGDTEAAAEATADIEAIAGQQIEDLKALERPEGDEETMAEFMALFEDFRDILGEQEAALRKADARAYNATLEPQQDLLDEMDAAAEEAGAEGCESEAG